MWPRGSLSLLALIPGAKRFFRKKGQEIDFSDEVCVEKIRITVRSMAGSSFNAAVGKDVTIGSLKAALASKLDLDVREFRLVCDAAAPPSEDTPIAALGKPGLSEVSEGAEVPELSLYLVKQTPLELHEARSLEQWREVARALENHTLEDDAVLARVTLLLDAHPALVNLQESNITPQSLLRPLLSYATEGAQSLSARQRCVDELLRRGARVSIRNHQGFLLDQARTSGSAFVDLLESQGRERGPYERDALSAWRDVSSKLCGETSQQVHDEAEMTRIVREFCEKHPEMVNFQSNHAVDAHDAPVGYFGYAPLVAFAGAQACRRRRGRADGGDVVRQDSVRELLRHGGRLDMRHGNRTSLEWMSVEGSLLLPWLHSQLNEPVPEQAAFEFSHT